MKLRLTFELRNAANPSRNLPLNVYIMRQKYTKLTLQASSFCCRSCASSPFLSKSALQRMEGYSPRVEQRVAICSAIFSIPGFRSLALLTSNNPIYSTYTGDYMYASFIMLTNQHESPPNPLYDLITTGTSNYIHDSTSK